ncbi:MAG: hypothetical protein RJA07_197 [Bacteroidota bacterium]|jgi:hypothetical protein
MKQNFFTRIIVVLLLLTAFTKMIKAQTTDENGNINIPTKWIHADSLRVRSIHVGDSSITIGGGGTGWGAGSTTTSGPANNNITCSNGVLNFGMTPPLNFTNMSMNIGTQTTTYKLHLHDATNASNSVNPFIHFTNTPTGQLTTDGFKVGIASNGSADLIQSEALPMRFYLNLSGLQPILRMYMQGNGTTSDGFVAIGNSFNNPQFRLDVNDNINVNSNTATSTTTNFINSGYRLGGNLVLALPNDNVNAHNTFVGRSGNQLGNPGTNNTYLGFQAGLVSSGITATACDYNTFIGVNSGVANITHWNTFLGGNLGQSNTTGSQIHS